MIVDDVQWADTASAGCLAYVAGALRGSRVLLIVTVRDAELTPRSRGC